jgi:hypothetical protein
VSVKVIHCPPIVLQSISTIHDELDPITEYETKFKHTAKLPE